MSFKLSSDVYSPDHIGIVLWEMEHLIGWLRDRSVQASVTGQAAVEKKVHLSHFLLGVLDAAGVSSDDQAGLEALHTQLRTVQSQAPVAHIILTALPTRTLKRQLVEWFRKEVHQQALVTFAVRGDIGGGFMLRIGSRQYDFTLRGQLLENKHRIAEIFNSVR